MVLTGGTSRRLGRDKATVHLQGVPLVARLVAQLPDDVPLVVVGPPLEDLPRPATFTRESPPGGGPLAAIGAGLTLVDTPAVAVLAVDVPFGIPVARAAAHRICVVETDNSIDGIDYAGRGVDAVVPVDPDGFAQPLCAAYRTDALREVVAALGPLADLPVRALLPHLRVMEWPVPAAALADVDTVDQLAAARKRAAEEATSMQEWVAAASEALGLEVAVDVDTILDVARDAAHNVERPAAPLTTYLLGAAVAQGADPVEAAATLSRLATTWAGRPQ
jgi:molybdopterin-guanine dinucleotide biosynthesis protein A